MEIIAFWRQNAQYLRVMAVTPEALADGIKPAAVRVPLTEMTYR
jgi:hypothetical protein